MTYGDLYLFTSRHIFYSLLNNFKITRILTYKMLQVILHPIIFIKENLDQIHQPHRQLFAYKMGRESIWIRVVLLTNLCYKKIPHYLSKLMQSERNTLTGKTEYSGQLGFSV